MPQKQKMEGEFKLHVPLDASGIKDFDPDRPVKVVIQSSERTTYSNTVQFDEKGKGAVEFAFSEQPGALRVMVGPPDASDEEMAGLQTLGFNIPAHRWLKEKKIKLDAVRISPYYWHWWLIWCRYFTIRGRVLCADGSPVPGATVCAYDMDWWWWWMSKQQVGCATTDETGAFEIKFRWCCGWWPWWWWWHRFWYLEPALVDRINPILERLPELEKIPTPGPKPDLSVFEEFLGEEFAELNIPQQKLQASPALKEISKGSKEIAFQARSTIDFSVLPELRKKLLKVLPDAPELKKLCIWPWWPWYPWRDCTPDIIFKVTQTCEEAERIIVDEGFTDVRWNIPTLLNVTLYANNEACCIDDTPDPVGNCVNITHACWDPVATIGGNLSAPPTPEGYKNPGIISSAGDRPYAGNISIRGIFGSLAGADYYEFEWYNSASGAWESLPLGTFSGFTRSYFGPQLPTGPIDTYYISFPVEPIDGKHVIKTRLYFEQNNGFGTWEVPGPGSRWWMNNKDMLLNWHTQNNFANGTYKLRVKTYRLNLDGTLTPMPEPPHPNPGILHQCGTSPPQDNYIVLRTDNRVETGGPNDAHGHPCGTGTVHYCTTEPDTCFLSIKILHSDGTEDNIAACGKYTINDTDMLQVDFVAHDPEGHLSLYTLKATYGVNLARNLLALGGTLTPSPVPVAWAPAAAQVGPNYANALLTGATSPTWNGGAIRLTLKAKDAFPETCCYQLELRAHKRTIVNCHHSLWGHINYSEYSFMIETT